MKFNDLKPWVGTAIAMLSTATAVGQTHTIEVKRNNQVIFSAPTSSIDYIDITTRLDAPRNVRAMRDNNRITLTWDAVAAATEYSILRSADGVNFAEIGTSVATSYTDKAPLPNANYYAVIAKGDNDITSPRSTVTAPVIFDSSLASGIYLGITGFNQALYNHPISFLGEESRDAYFSFVDNLESKNGTILYYCADQSITALQGASYPTDLFNVAMVTFTDGLDQGSFMMESPYTDDEEYMDGINNRITGEQVAGVPITAYSIGLRGTDVVDSEKFKLNLQKLASSPEYAFEVANMDEVKEKFKEIAQQLVETSSVHTVVLNMPGLANGTRVRFTFDNISDVANSNLYIEGTFSLSDFKLNDVVYHGMTSEAGNSISGEREGIFVKYTFDGVRTDSKKALPFDYLKEWTYINSTSSWQPNSEFNKDEGSAIETIRRSAAIMLNLDCSSSLGSKDFANVKENAKGFIATLLQQDYEGGGTGEDPSEDPGDDYYKFEYVDLGLPSGTKWATCNIGASQPEEIGSYFAWGETKAKTSYESDNSTTFAVTYTTLVANSIINSNGVLMPEYDAARQNLGEGWRMPTDAEYIELINNCSHAMETYKGVYGIRFTGSNGKSIFMPCAGYIDSKNVRFTSVPSYWASSVDRSFPYSAKRFYRYKWSSENLGCTSGDYSLSNSSYDTIRAYREYGMPIRAVHD